MSRDIFHITIRARSGDTSRVTAVWRHSDGSPVDHYDGSAILADLRPDELKTDKIKTTADYGKLLAKAILTEQISGGLSIASHAAERLHVLLSVEDPELATLRWERLQVTLPGSKCNFLAGNKRTPFSFYIPTSSLNSRPPVSRENVRALVLASSPTEPSWNLSPFDAPAAAKSIRNALADTETTVLAFGDDCDGDPTWECLQNTLNATPYHILHIICHGRYRHPETSLFLSKADNSAHKLPDRALIEFLRLLGQDLPSLIFLASCETALPEAEKALGGLAQNLVRECGVPAVIAMTGKVSIPTIEALSRDFYTFLKQHGEPDFALAQATVELHKRRDFTVAALFSRLEGRPIFLPSDLPTSVSLHDALCRLKDLVHSYSPSLDSEFHQDANDLIKRLRGDATTALRREALRVADQYCDMLGLDIDSLKCEPRLWKTCPFVGSAPFSHEHADLFCGRKREIDACASMLTGERRFCAVIGPPGSGKSSLVLAGVSRKLSCANHSVQVIRPDDDPLGQLRPALAPSSQTDSLLFIDQLEELLIYCTNEDVQREFLTELSNASRKRPVLVALQEEYLENFRRFEHFYQDVLSHSLKLRIPSKDELRIGIERQCENAGLRLEDGLLAAVFGDIQEQRGMMSLVQQTMTLLWGKRYGRWLRYAAYRDGGGITETVRVTLRSILDELDTHAQATRYVQTITERLTKYDEKHVPETEPRDARRLEFRRNLHVWSATSEEQSELCSVLRRLEKGGLVCRDGEQVKAIHDAVIRVSAEVFSLDESERRKRVSRQDIQHCLKTDAELRGATLRKYRSTLYDILNSEERGYLEECRRKKNRRIAVCCVVIVCILAALGAGVYFLGFDSAISRHIAALDWQTDGDVQSVYNRIARRSWLRRKWAAERRAQLRDAALSDFTTRSRYDRESDRQLSHRIAMLQEPERTSVVAARDAMRIAAWDVAEQQRDRNYDAVAAGCAYLSAVWSDPHAQSAADDAELAALAVLYPLAEPPFRVSAIHDVKLCLENVRTGNYDLAVVSKRDGDFHEVRLGHSTNFARWSERAAESVSQVFFSPDGKWVIATPNKPGSPQILMRSSVARPDQTWWEGGDLNKERIIDVDFWANDRFVTIDLHNNIGCWRLEWDQGTTRPKCYAYVNTADIAKGRGLKVGKDVWFIPADGFATTPDKGLTAGRYLFNNEQSKEIRVLTIAQQDDPLITTIKNSRVICVHSSQTGNGSLCRVPCIVALPGANQSDFDKRDSVAPIIIDQTEVIADSWLNYDKSCLFQFERRPPKLCAYSLIGDTQGVRSLFRPVPGLVPTGEEHSFSIPAITADGSTFVTSMSDDMRVWLGRFPDGKEIFARPRLELLHGRRKGSDARKNTLEAQGGIPAKAGTTGNGSDARENSLKAVFVDKETILTWGAERLARWNLSSPWTEWPGTGWCVDLRNSRAAGYQGGQILVRNVAEPTPDTLSVDVGCQCSEADWAAVLFCAHSLVRLELCVFGGLCSHNVALSTAAAAWAYHVTAVPTSMGEMLSRIGPTIESGFGSLSYIGTGELMHWCRTGDIFRVNLKDRHLERIASNVGDSDAVVVQVSALAANPAQYVVCYEDDEGSYRFGIVGDGVEAGPRLIEPLYPGQELEFCEAIGAFIDRAQGNLLMVRGGQSAARETVLDKLLFKSDGTVTKFKCAAHGKVLVTASDRGSVTAWDVSSIDEGRLIELASVRSPSDQLRKVRALEVADDGNTVAVTYEESEGTHRMGVWRITHERMVPLESELLSEEGYRVCISERGDRVALFSGSRFAVADVGPVETEGGLLSDTLEVVRPSEGNGVGYPIHGLQLCSRSNRLVISGSNPGFVQVWSRIGASYCRVANWFLPEVRQQEDATRFKVSVSATEEYIIAEIESSLRVLPIGREEVSDRLHRKLKALGGLIGQ